MEHTFIGLDVGTQGARAILADAHGRVLASFSEPFALSAASREEQSPEQWWEACERLLSQILQQPEAASLRAIGVTSTSGTVIPVDEAGTPLHPAIMYSDGRQAETGQRCKALAQKYHPQGYTAFNTTSGLPKMVWFAEQFPEKARRIHKFIHAADFITGKLTGNFNVTDFTNVLKSGYDVANERWPEYIWGHLPIRREWLQEVIPSGTPVGSVTAHIARMPANVLVTAGMTDGCASQIASGAVTPGAWNTTIGTTLVVKGVTEKPVPDPLGRLYNHRHPQGFWMPGGASNTGADWISKHFPGNLDALNEAAAAMVPTGKLYWPLEQPGERFPFVAPQAKAFETPGLEGAEKFAAGMEGVAYIEKMAYELIEQLSGETVKAVYTAGGASNSHVWLRIRACVLGVPVHKMQEVSGAAGAAILAASQTHYGSISEAAAAMTHIDKTMLPEPGLQGAYAEGYRSFREKLKEKGYA
ncbi:FGGY-family carbohydrate kinase [Chitinophaga caseinilytica]|uniref:FGGY-family carbohydrate kinase n=1 Tax=Chitinophaga caseinilytica TaxID=2267521 RepID=A0ABZ2Z0H2_9BACT